MHHNGSQLHLVRSQDLSVPPTVPSVGSPFDFARGLGPLAASPSKIQRLLLLLLLLSLSSSIVSLLSVTAVSCIFPSSSSVILVLPRPIAPIVCSYPGLQAPSAARPPAALL
ncbi:hypothetical protein VTN02DRAFT_1049 [Thermoascus thermophilus]